MFLCRILFFWSLKIIVETYFSPRICSKPSFCHYLCFIETDFNTSALNFLHSASTLFVRYCEMCRNGVFFFFFITIPFVSEAAWVHLCPSSVAPCCSSHSLSLPVLSVRYLALLPLSSFGFFSLFQVGG